MTDKKLIALSLGEFALPSPRRGSIDALSGYGSATEQGIEIHQLVQRRRERECPGYQAEVPLRFELERGRFLFRVSGRIDGLIRSGGQLRIEEIKSSFQARALSKRLRAERLDHPYVLQLLSYGYFYGRQEGLEPELRFLLVSTRSREEEELELPLDRGAYEAWLERRLGELEREAEHAESRAARRREQGRALRFPFERPRSGQLELIAEIEGGIRERRRLLLQAPTGLGKTAGVLFPVLRDALSRGQRVVYVTPKNSQHAVAEDAVERLQERGAKIRSLTITAKSKICFKNEPLCNPSYCEYARGHYTRVAEHDVPGKLARKRKLTKKVFQELAREHELCPFEIQLDAAADAEVVICDYNYVFAPRSAFGRLAASGLDQEGKPDLVIDEAHNLPSRAMDYYSPELSSLVLLRIREQLTALPANLRIEALELLDGCLALLRECAPPGVASRTVKIRPPAENFLDQELRLRSFLSRYLESEEEILSGDPVLRLCFYWGEFSAALEYVDSGQREEFLTSFAPHPSGGIVRITCCDASSFLRDSYDDYEQVVAFSATLKPFEYYARLSGLEGAHSAEFLSPFPPENRKLLLIPQISSKYAQRTRSTPRIAEAIGRIARLRPGNYIAFFPSFDFLEQVLARFHPPPGFGVRRQERQMRADELTDLLNELREAREPLLVFAVSGGVLSEGVDFPGSMLIGAFVVGPPLPSFELEREEMRAYYERRYGSGFDYAYTFPAMAKAVQAAGRVIRSESDRGLVVLMDPRFLEPSYSKSMPGDWFAGDPKELVSTGILQELESFWSRDAAALSPGGGPE